MITTRVLIKNPDTDVTSFEDFESKVTSLIMPERNSHLDDLRFCIQQGWIKNLQNKFWDQNSKSLIYEYYSDDLHQTRYFQNYMTSRPNFSQGIVKIQEAGWSFQVETVPESVVIPFVDAQRIFDQDVEILV
jgi:hypothetical protein